MLLLSDSDEATLRENERKWFFGALLDHVPRFTVCSSDPRALICASFSLVKTGCKWPQGTVVKGQGAQPCHSGQRKQAMEDTKRTPALRHLIPPPICTSGWGCFWWVPNAFGVQLFTANSVVVVMALEHRVRSLVLGFRGLGLGIALMCAGQTLGSPPCRW